MKKFTFAIMTVLLVTAIAFTSGCGKTENKKDTSDVPTVTEKGAATRFKTGTWASDTGVNYVFYDDGKSGRSVTVADGMGVGFTYELDANGNCVFHMGSADDITKTTVEFIDGSDDIAAITFEDGSRLVFMFVDKNTSDEFADTYVLDGITASQE